MDRHALNAPIPGRVAPLGPIPYAGAQQPAPALALRGVGLSRAGRGQLQDIDLQVARGAFVTVLGPARSGKSALLSILAGTAAGTGQATLFGADLMRTPPHRRGLGVVQQDDALFPHLTLAGNICYPLRLRGVAWREADGLVEAALESVQLAGGDRLPAEATPAERQRAALARATIFSPRMLLLDEPLSEQPPAERQTMLAMLRRLHVLLGTTTLMATRVGADALALSDAVAVLDAGRLEQMAEPGPLYDRPCSATAALATGEANLLAGVVNAIDEEGTARVTLACGPVVEAMASDTLRVRDKCLVFVRPERIAIAAMSASDMGETALDATLIEALHLGEAVRLRLLLGSGAEVLIKRPAAAGLRGLRPGQQVAIAWPQALVFPKVRSGA
jgi:ABC-type Fe3+/spermidine/putrescine transport system ATPase subunit